MDKGGKQPMKYRYYKPKERLWTSAGLQQAVAQVQRGGTISGTAKAFNMSFYTLYNAVQAAKKPPGEPAVEKGVQGRKPILSKDIEEDVAALIRGMARAGFGVRKSEIGGIILEFCLSHGVGFTEAPGKKYIVQFCQRHKLTRRKEKMLSVSREEGTSNPFIAYDFYRQMQSCVEQLKADGVAEEKLSAHIWNVDETGFPNDPPAGMVVGGSGERTGGVREGKGRSSTTVVGCVSADGRALPPMVLFSLKNRPSDEILDGCMPGMTMDVAPKGWITKELFQGWFEQFCETVKERPLLLLFDGHTSHVALAVLEKAKAENIILLKLPPHTTDLLQPLDVVCFASLKAAWATKLKSHVRTNPGRKLSRNDFCVFISELWEDHFSYENVMAAFRKSGVWPIDSDRYPKDRLNAKLLRKYDRWINNGSPELSDEQYVEFITALSPTKSPVKPAGSDVTDAEEDDQPSCSTSQAIRRLKPLKVKMPAGVVVPPMPSEEPRPAYAPPDPSFEAKWTLSWVPVWVPPGGNIAGIERPPSARTPEEKTQLATEKILAKRFGTTPPVKKRKYAEQVTSPGFIELQRAKEEKRAAAMARKEAKAKATKAPTKAPPKKKRLEAQSSSESEAQTPPRLDSSDDEASIQSPVRLEYPPKTPAAAMSHLRAVWEYLLPPKEEAALVEQWFALLYFDGAAAKPKLFLGCLKRRFLQDEESRVTDRFEFKCLEPTILPGNKFREPTKPDIDYFKIYDIIDGPLPVTHLKGREYEFLGCYQSLKTVSNMVADLPRQEEAERLGYVKADDVSEAVALADPDLQ